MTHAHCLTQTHTHTHRCDIGMISSILFKGNQECPCVLPVNGTQMKCATALQGGQTGSKLCSVLLFNI